MTTIINLKLFYNALDFVIKKYTGENAVPHLFEAIRKEVNMQLESVLPQAYLVSLRFDGTNWNYRLNITGEIACTH